MNMVAFGKKVVKFRIPILIISILLLIPAGLGYVNTRVNYDVLTYLPEDIETMQGQDILVKDFGTGAFSMFIVDGMEDKDVSALKAKIEKVDHVQKVLWYDSLADISMPKSMMPKDVYEVFNSDTGTMMAIFFDEGTSSDGTMEAIGEIRKLAGKQCFLSGMSAIVTDTKNLAEKETPLYVLIAVVLAVIVLGLTMDSYFIPLLFMLSIGMAIIYNLGSNYFLGEISYITKALAAVLQLGVTLDYSIFLMHSYEEQQARYNGDKERAMAHAISQTFSSVIGSSVTTVAGFIALCFMTFTLGMDIGVVMVKGVVLGVIACVTILPSMILCCDKWITKTMHKPFLPDIGRISDKVTKRYMIYVIIFLVLLFPAIYGNNHTSVYYNLDETLPKDLPSIIANEKLKERGRFMRAMLVTGAAFAAIDKRLPLLISELLTENTTLDDINKVISSVIPGAFSVEKKLIELLEKQSGLHTSVDCSTPLTEQSLSRNDGEDQTRRNAENMFGDD